MTSQVLEHGKQFIPRFVSFSMTRQTEILSTESSEFVKHAIILDSFDSVFCINSPTQQILTTYFYSLRYKLAVHLGFLAYSRDKPKDPD